MLKTILKVCGDWVVMVLVETNFSIQLKSRQAEHLLTHVLASASTYGPSSRPPSTDSLPA